MDASHTPAGDGPEADGCALDFAEHADDELTASLRPLFPDGDPAGAGEWRELEAAGALEAPWHPGPSS